MKVALDSQEFNKQVPKNQYQKPNNEKLVKKWHIKFERRNRSMCILQKFAKTRHWKLVI